MWRGEPRRCAPQQARQDAGGQPCIRGLSHRGAKRPCRDAHQSRRERPGGGSVRDPEHFGSWRFRIATKTVTVETRDALLPVPATGRQRQCGDRPGLEEGGGIHRLHLLIPHCGIMKAKITSGAKRHGLRLHHDPTTSPRTKDRKPDSLRRMMLATGRRAASRARNMTCAGTCMSAPYGPCRLHPQVREPRTPAVRSDGHVARTGNRVADEDTSEWMK